MKLMCFQYKPVKGIVFALTVGRLVVGLFNRWLGFEYRNFHEEGKRLDIGFVKFWWKERRLK